MHEPGSGRGVCNTAAQPDSTWAAADHHGFNRIIFINGHGSNVKVIDPSCASCATGGALISFVKPYAGELRRHPRRADGSPGRDAGLAPSELETSQDMAWNRTSSATSGPSSPARTSRLPAGDVRQKRTACRTWPLKAEVLHLRWTTTSSSRAAPSATAAGHRRRARRRSGGSRARRRGVLGRRSRSTHTREFIDRCFR